MSFASRFAPKGNKGSFVAQIIKGKVMVCELAFAAHSGIGQAWYVLQVDSAKAKEFKESLKESGPITLTDYGEILHFGWGEGPDDALKAELHEKYGLYED